MRFLVPIVVGLVVVNDCLKNGIWHIEGQLSLSTRGGNWPLMGRLVFRRLVWMMGFGGGGLDS